MNDLIYRQKAIATADSMLQKCDGDINDYHDLMVEALEVLPPETSRIVIGRSKGGVTMWHECECCHQPVDLQDAYCCGCGRRFVHE